MSTPVTIGSTRQLWFARLTDATPQWSFLEDPVGITKRSAQQGRSIRLGDPINTGPNSTWHQLTWEGGEGQDIWDDVEMYQWGDADVLSSSGKVRMWPGFLAWAKFENMSSPRRMVMQQGNRSDNTLAQLANDLTGSVLYAAEGDLDQFEHRAPHYLFYQLHPNYPPSDPRAIQYVGEAPDPFRFISPMNSDDGISSVQMVATASKLYTFTEATHAFVLDPNTPAQTTANWEFMHDSARDFGTGFYYLHGNRLMKRVAQPPYGVTGTHTVVKWLRSAAWCRGMEVWNNRLYFGAMYPNGTASIFVSDGATTTKAFDMPGQSKIQKLCTVAGALYILTSQSADVSAGTAPSTAVGSIVQQLWRYDGRGLKKLWQQGTFSDGYAHWPSDITNFNGLVCWGRQGTPEETARANLMFYDPVRDSIVRGPGLDLDAANVGAQYRRGLWVTGIQPWHNTLMTFFKDDTVYSSSLKCPGMLATVRPENFPKSDLRANLASNGDISQFQASVGSLPSNYIVSSEYHGTDDVATELKTWLSVRVRARLTGANAQIEVRVMHPKGDRTASVADSTVVGTINWAAVGSQTDWVDLVFPCKDATGAYFKSQKIQLLFKLSNISTDYASIDMPWVDDVAVQWNVSPKPRRQFQVRIPITEAQQTLAGAPNALSTSNLLAQKLEDLYFAGDTVKFWEPTDSASTPRTAPVIVQKAAITGGAAANTVASNALPVGATAGNLLVAFHEVSSATTPSLPSGWTLGPTQLNTNSSFRFTMFYKVAVGGETTVSVTTGGSAAFTQVGLIELSGVDTTSPIGASSTKDSEAATATSVAATPLSPAPRDSLTFAIFGIDGLASPGFTFSNSYDGAAGYNGANVLGVGVKQAAVAGESCTGTWGVNLNYVALLVEFQAPAPSSYIECQIADFQRQQARVASNETGDIGYVTLTLIENVIA